MQVPFLCPNTFALCSMQARLRVRALSHSVRLFPFIWSFSICFTISSIPPSKFFSRLLYSQLFLRLNQCSDLFTKLNFNVNLGIVTYPFETDTKFNPPRFRYTCRNFARKWKALGGGKLQKEPKLCKIKTITGTKNTTNQKKGEKESLTVSKVILVFSHSLGFYDWQW